MWRRSWPARSLERSEDAVARVAETGDDVMVRIEALVPCCGEDGHVGVLLLDLRDAFGRGDEVEEDDAAVAELLELRERVARAAAGREHRVDDDGDLVVLGGWDFRVVGDGLGRGLVALHAEDADLRVGEDVEHGVEHAHAGAQDRDDDDGVLDLDARRLGDRRRDGDFDRAQVLQAFDGEEFRDFVDKLAKLLRFGVDVAHQRDAMLDERVCKNRMHDGIVYHILAVRGHILEV